MESNAIVSAGIVILSDIPFGNVDNLLKNTKRRDVGGYNLGLVAVTLWEYHQHY